MNDRIQTLLGSLATPAPASAAEQARSARRANWIAEFSLDEFAEFLEGASQLDLPLDEHADRLLASWLAAGVQARRKRATSPDDLGAVERVAAAIEPLYGLLGTGSSARAQLLAWLACGGESDELELLARLLIADPPRAESDVAQALAPLFQQQRTTTAALFPGLLEALAHPQLAAPVLDLANFLTRQRLAEEHPAADHAGQLQILLGELVQSLTKLEEHPDEISDSPLELSRRVTRGVALAVSLCDALALIGEKSAIGKLYQALQISHRRVRTEAAAALARLGEKAGEDELVQLAAEPVARLRVLAYAKELGIDDKIAPEHSSPAARAEAELCVWLAEPTQYGLPPTWCELFDERQQFWPGFSGPIACYLFRFQYVVTVEDEGERSFSNIGIAGPLTHAFVADLGDLAPDDIYAAFAGWQAQHEDIQEFDVARLSQSEQVEVERLKRRLHDAGFSHLEPQTMGYFFGDKALVAAAQREGVAGIAVADFQEIAFYPERSQRRPLGPAEAYCIYKGRKLLKTFNESGVRGE